MKNLFTSVINFPLRRVDLILLDFPYLHGLLMGTFRYFEQTVSSDASVSMEFTSEELWKLILAVRTIISPVRRNNRAGTVVNDRCSIYFHPR